MEIIVYDHQICVVNGNKVSNFAASLVYKTKDGLHEINFEECTKNFQEKYSSSSGNCIGERNMEANYFLLFTNGIQTKIFFKKAFVFPIQNCLLYGTKQNRFFKLQALIEQTKYTTRDLT